MMAWHAVVPFKHSADAKSRLASFLDAQQRTALSRKMLMHVLQQLQECQRVRHVTLLAPEPLAGPDCAWFQDQGRGLNAELSRFRETHQQEALLVIHADLPRVTAADIDRLLIVAEQHGAALATDRAGEGSNALAQMPHVRLNFVFGPGSRHAFVQQRPDLPVLQLDSLALDVDHPEDLGAAADWLRNDKV